MPRCLRPILFAAVSFCSFGATTFAFQPAKIASSTTHHHATMMTATTEASSSPPSHSASTFSAPFMTQVATQVASSAATAALSAFLFLTIATTSAVSPAFAADAIPPQDMAAQITLNRLPPTSISVQVKDLPVVGNILSGYYSKIPDSIDVKKNPSIVITSPVDKGKAIQSIVKNGHLAFDIHGVIENHVEVDISAEKAGVMNVRVASDLIPKLPFTNIVAAGGKESPWNTVTNMGSGEVYYYNEKTGVTQYAKPQI